MAKPFKTPSNELADIAVNHFAIQHAREQVSPQLQTCGHNPPGQKADSPHQPQ